LQAVDDTDRAQGAYRLPDHLHPVLEGGKYRLETLDDHLVVIDEDESHRFDGGRHHHGNTITMATP
jgi:hypothetical protein